MRKITVLFALLFAAGSLSAHERIFTYSYTTDPVPEGLVEYEQWVTVQHGGDGGYSSLIYTRTEVEFAISPRLTLDLYLNLKSRYRIGEREAEYYFEPGLSAAFIYRMLNPTFHPVGLGMYGEVTYSPRETEFEEKLLLSRNFGNFVLASNLILAQKMEYIARAVTEGSETRYETAVERGAIFEITGGISYRIGNWSLGLEAINSRGWSGSLLPGGSPEGSEMLFGPVIHYSSPKFSISVTALPVGGPEFRTIFGIRL